MMKLQAEHNKQEERVMSIVADLETQLRHKAEKVGPLEGVGVSVAANYVCLAQVRG